jgi:inner membrane protein
MSRAGLNRKTGLATATLTLAAEAPDLDVLGRIKGPVFAFAHHRGFTHSFLGLFLMSVIVIGLVYLIWRIRGRKTNNPDLPPRWGLLFLFSYLAGLSHILLDYTNNYGVRPFWPFSEKWYSWDIVFIVEPAILILLTGGLVLPAVVGWIRKSPVHSVPRGRLGAASALFGVVILWGLRDLEHRHAVHVARTGSYQGTAPIRASAYPYWWTPFLWYSVAETKDSCTTMVLHSSHSDIPHLQIYYKPAETPVTLAAKRSYLGRVYLDWAQYPLVQSYRVTDSDVVAYRVQFQDLRYAYPDMAGRAALSASVELNRKLEVVGETFGSRRERLSPPD